MNANKEIVMVVRRATLMEELSGLVWRLWYRTKSRAARRARVEEGATLRESSNSNYVLL